MIKTLIPPTTQHINPSTCTVNDEVVVVLFKGNGVFDPESSPGNVEQMACDTNGAGGKDENVDFTLSNWKFIQVRDGVLYDLRNTEFSDLGRKSRNLLTASRDTIRSQNWKQIVATSSATSPRKLS
jgi:hypothetical protein